MIKQKNLTAFKNFDPDSFIVMNGELVNDNTKCELLEARSGDYSLKVIKDNRELLINSMRDPKQEAKRFVQRIEKQSGNFIVIYGLGLGYHVLETFEQIIKRKDNAKLIVVEPSGKIFLKAIEVNDFSELFAHKRVQFSIGRNTDLIRDKIGLLFKMYQNDSIKVFEFNVYRRLFPKFIEEVDKTLKNVLSVGVSNYTTVINYIDEWHGNILENLEHIIKSPGVVDYQSTFKDKPAVIVSAGPSLDKNGHLLKKLRGKALIIAVDTAVKPLLSIGVEPDIVVSVDSQYANYMHLEGVRLDKAFALVSPIVYPDVPKIFDGRLIFFNFFFQLSFWIEEHLKANGILVTGGSVATVAFDFARKIGADPIVMVGQDFAFSYNYNHAVETYWDQHFFDNLSKAGILQNEHRKQIMESGKTIIDAKDIYGRNVKTFRVLDDYCKWMEYECGQTTGTMVNATEGGILKENLINMTLNESIDKYMQEDIDIRGIMLDNFNVLTRKQVYDFSKKLQQVNDNLDFIDSMSDRGREMIRTLYDKLKRDEFDRQYRKLAKKVEELGVEMENRIRIGSFIVEKFQTKFWPLLRKLQSNETYTQLKGDEKKLEELNLKYEILREVSQELAPDFKKAQEKVKEYLKTL